MISIRLRLTGFGGGHGQQRGEQRISLSSPATVKTLLDYLADRPGALGSTTAVGSLSLDALLIAVNGRLIQHQQGLDTPLTEGDRVTLMPPVVGG